MIVYLGYILLLGSAKAQRYIYVTLFFYEFVIKILKIHVLLVLLEPICIKKLKKNIISTKKIIRAFKG